MMAERQQYSESDPRHHIIKIRGMPYDVVQHVREYRLSISVSDIMMVRDFFLGFIKIWMRSIFSNTDAIPRYKMSADKRENGIPNS